MYGLESEIVLGRLEMANKVKVGESKNLNTFWSQKVTEELNRYILTPAFTPPITLQLVCVLWLFPADASLTKANEIIVASHRPEIWVLVMDTANSMYFCFVSILWNASVISSFWGKHNIFPIKPPDSGWYKSSQRISNFLLIVLLRWVVGNYSQSLETRWKIGHAPTSPCVFTQRHLLKVQKGSWLSHDLQISEDWHNWF